MIVLVPIVPPLSDLSVLDPHEGHAGERERLLRRCNTEVVAVVCHPGCPPTRHRIPLRNEIIDCKPNVRESAAKLQPKGLEGCWP
jgi:hypothetical protein